MHIQQKKYHAYNQEIRNISLEIHLECFGRFIWIFKVENPKRAGNMNAPSEPATYVHTQPLHFTGHPRVIVTPALQSLYSHRMLVWNDNTDQTYSCPRDQHLSASWRQVEGPRKPLLDPHITIVFRGLRWALKQVPIMPRDHSLLESGCNSLQSRYTLRKLYFDFLSNRMGYDRGDSFPFDFLNQMEFHSVQNRKEKTVTTIISHSM